MSDGLVRLSPDVDNAPEIQPGLKPLFYVEDPQFAWPEAEADTKIRGLLNDGLDPASGDLGREDMTVVPSDETGLSANIANGRDWFGSSTSDVVTGLLKSGYIVHQEMVDQAVQLQSQAADWSSLWEERERAATILARLRTADEAGSLWREISSLAARLAVMALLIYLVNLYRYNMRLAAFYEARGNAIDSALALSNSLDAEALSMLAKAHTPQEVAFGNRPQPPSDATLTAIADITQIAKK